MHEPHFHRILTDTGVVIRRLIPRAKKDRWKVLSILQVCCFFWNWWDYFFHFSNPLLDATIVLIRCGIYDSGFIIFIPKTIFH